ncbi:MAG: hypoxanthine-guanine phosphoribosyltransferase [Neisseriaceae bacterium]|nr:hypoxanthine-guanine phosphoribosyltransferase [Neisseriaceae bacterium]MBQ9619520.1 hypoxanthine-guanine phosphoribosyltransferase [Neisseriaceae bacterium]
MDLQKYTSVLQEAELLFDEITCQKAIKRIATEITEQMSELVPLVLPVMGGAVVFTGQLLPLLKFPLDFDYVHVSRYGNCLTGDDLEWKRMPHQEIRGRHILLLDDILDEGITMAALKEKMLNMGALSCRCAVFANKLLDKEKPIQADFVGLDVPNRYVFGYGMDVHGMWRNLGEIYALKES